MADIVDISDSKFVFEVEGAKVSIIAYGVNQLPFEKFCQHVASASAHLGFVGPAFSGVVGHAAEVPQSGTPIHGKVVADIHGMKQQVEEATAVSDHSAELAAEVLSKGKDEFNFETLHEDVATNTEERPEAEASMLLDPPLAHVADDCLNMSEQLPQNQQTIRPSKPVKLHHNSQKPYQADKDDALLATMDQTTNSSNSCWHDGDPWQQTHQVAHAARCHSQEGGGKTVLLQGRQKSWHEQDPWQSYRRMPLKNDVLPEELPRPPERSSLTDYKQQQLVHAIMAPAVERADTLAANVLAPTAIADRLPEVEQDELVPYHVALPRLQTSLANRDISASNYTQALIALKRRARS